MRKLVVGIVFGALLGVASPALAIDFKLESYKVNLLPWDDNFGLDVWTKDYPPSGPLDFSLMQGESKTVGLFYIGTNEGSVGFDDWIPYLANVELKFSAPQIAGGQVLGLTGGGYYGNKGGEDYGYVAWNNPLSISFGSAGTLEIWLSDEKFAVPTQGPGSLVEITFKLTGGTTNRVPEPSSAALLGIGFAIATRFRRRVNV
jgi:hypothetical protein